MKKPAGENPNCIAHKIRESKENVAFSFKMRGFYLSIILLKTTLYIKIMKIRPWGKKDVNKQISRQL